MSTRLTKKDIPMVDSKALQLVLGASQVSELITGHLSKSLQKMGYKAATPATLSFLSMLECGVNYGSELARKLGVSRQMVAKTVKELCFAGYLEQVDGTGKQKEILFTATGELLMSDARKLLADMDKTLSKQLGDKPFANTVNNLANIRDVMMQLNDAND